jgi:ethanolamine permease
VVRIVSGFARRIARQWEQPEVDCMANDGRHGSVRYESVAADYFEKRGLRRHAGLWSLWALGVGAVISGDFSGWNFGLGAGGFGGLLIATVIITILYLGLCYSIAEMTAALPHTGGAYSFGRSAMGPWGGFVTGLAENMEYVLTPAVVVFFAGAYLGSIFATPEWFAPIWWLLGYAVFVGLNIAGVEITFGFTVVITLLALAALAVLWIGALPHFDAALLLDIPAAAGGSSFLPFGLSGVLFAMPFAIWFYLAIEQLPLAAEEADQPTRDLPRGILIGFGTLVVCAFLTLFLNVGIAPGADALKTSAEPVLDGYRTIFGDGAGTRVLGLVAVAGLIASFHTIIFAYGRNIYSLSRAGYFPRFLSITHPTRKTPYVALIAGGAIGYAVLLVLHLLGKGELVGATVLNMAVWGAVIAYAMQSLAFILLRLRRPDIARPYRSALGLPGALVALVISAAVFVVQFGDPAYRPAIWWCALWFLAGLAYFAVHARFHMVLSPEEEFAIRSRESGT